MDPTLPDEPHSKLNQCIDNVFQIWADTKGKRLTQLVFCDLSTPKRTIELHENQDTGAFEADAEELQAGFNVYFEMYDKLKTRGIPAHEIAFIHDAKTDAKKAELFAKVRSGQVRVLIGSTAKMGAGTNVQTKLVALHHLDVPWRPSDIEQREGRMLRQGNMNEEVMIFRYVTSGTFDAYSWGLIENKQRYISQVMSSKSALRRCDEVDEAVLSYAEIKALATGDPRIKEKFDLETNIARLQMLKSNHVSQKYRLQDNLATKYPLEVAQYKEVMQGLERDIERLRQNRQQLGDSFSMVVNDVQYTEKDRAGQAILMMCAKATSASDKVDIGQYLGFDMSVDFHSLFKTYKLYLTGTVSHIVELGSDEVGNITRINNCLDKMEERLAANQQQLDTLHKQIETAKTQVEAPFGQQQELDEKTARYNLICAEMNLDERMGDTMEDIEVADELLGSSSKEREHAQER